MEQLLRIEGLRWLAAIIVFISHFGVVFYPDVYWGGFNNSYNYLVAFFHYTPLGLLVNGNFGIHVFLAISGFVLYYSWHNKSKAINLYTYINRYLRLMLPALISILISYILFKLGLVYFFEAVKFTGQSPWIAFYSNLVPGFIAVVIQGVYNLFFMLGQSNYNPALWILGYFWLGSVLLYTVLFFFKNRYWQLSIIIILAITSLLFGLSSFWGGVLLAISFTDNKLWLSIKKNIPNTFYIVGITVVIILASYPTVEGHVQSMYSLFRVPGVNFVSSAKLFHMIAGTLLFAIVLLDPKSICTKLLEKIHIYGKYAYSLYIIHSIILISISSWLYVKLRLFLSHDIAAILVLLVTIISLMPLSFLYYKVVDDSVGKLIKKIYSGASS